MSRFEHHNISDDIECDCDICTCEDADECEELECKCCSLECYGERVTVKDDMINRFRNVADQNAY